MHTSRLPGYSGSSNGTVPRLHDFRDHRLHRAVLCAVAYSDVFDYPLTAAEVHRYLPGASAPKHVVEQLLDNGDMVPDWLVESGGYFALPGRTELRAVRRERESAARKLWPEAMRYGRIIAGIPFVRMVAVTGELAVNNVARESDIDYFIVTEPGRLWLTRAMVILVVKAAARRGVTVCPNYLVTENALLIDQRNLYTAREMAQMVPIAGLDVYQRLRQANPWVSEFLPNADGIPVHLHAIDWNGRIRRFSEQALRTPIGDRIERWEMNRKIAKLTRDSAPDEEVAFARDWCKGHFDRHGQRTLDAYAKRVQAVEGLLS